jgi:hypothetical protein
MRRDQIAELILSLFTSPERAASIIGDLEEDAPARGNFWFWECVARTVFSLLRHDLTAEPLFLLGLAVRGTLFSLRLVALWSVLILLGIVVVAAVVVQIKAAAGPAPSWVHGQAVMDSAGYLLGLTAMVMIEFRVGQWLARRARGREMAACLAYLAFGYVLWSVTAAILYAWFAPAIENFLQNFHPQPKAVDVPAGWMLFYGFVSYAAFFAGGIRVRRSLASDNPV